MRAAIYARVSTDRGEQDPQVQVGALRPWLEANGHEVAAIYEDRVSGAKSERPGLGALERAIEAGEVDAVAVVKLDRLARSVNHLTAFSQFLSEHGADLIVKDQAIDTTTPAGKLLFHVLGAVAEFERDLIAERTRAGLAHAKANGTRTGRPIGRPRAEVDVARAWREVARLGSKAAAARALGVPRRTLSDALARAE